MQGTHVSVLSGSRESDFLSATFDPSALYHVKSELAYLVGEGSLPLPGGCAASDLSLELFCEASAASPFS